uniref:Uncharacterized protein n=1 Tax=Romanomermis culicivorax TaxID=13658 RepID=A0A915JJF1_ROMCU
MAPDKRYYNDNNNNSPTDFQRRWYKYNKRFSLQQWTI